MASRLLLARPALLPTRAVPTCDTLQPYLNASAKATLPGSTEQVPREVQPGEQDRFIGAHHQQEAKDGSCRAEETGAEWWQKWPRLSVEIPIPIRLMSTLGVNCLLPMQKESSDMRHFLLAGIGKRTVSPQSDTGGEVENHALFERACVHSERENGLRHQYPKWTSANSFDKQQ